MAVRKTVLALSIGAFIVQSIYSSASWSLLAPQTTHADDQLIDSLDGWIARSQSGKDDKGDETTSSEQHFADRDSRRSSSHAYRRAARRNVARVNFQDDEAGESFPQLSDPFLDDPIQPAESQAPLEDVPAPLHAEPAPMHDPYYGKAGCDSTGNYISDHYNDCDSCGGCYSGSCCPTCGCGPPGCMWFGAEYLMWWTRGMRVPPLVTTAPDGAERFVPGTTPPVPFAGAIGQPGTNVLFGNERLFDDMRSGTRLRVGAWLDGCQWLGVEADWFTLGEDHERYLGISLAGDPILARPFFDVSFNNGQGVQGRQLVGFPDVIEGTIRVDAQNTLHSAGVRARMNLCCGHFDLGPCCDVGCLSQVTQGTTRLDFLLGYKFMRMDDRLRIREDLVTLDQVIQQQFVVRDSFDANTEFHGVDLGMIYEFHRCRWSFELLTKIAIGNNRQRVDIDGNTDITLMGMTTPRVGGLLAQSTNIGSYSNDQFSVIPEVGVTLGYRMNDKLKLSFGYTFIYWSNVVRAGEQIDFNVDARLLADPPPNDATRPRFAFQDTGFWAQGLNFGAELRW